MFIASSRLWVLLSCNWVSQLNNSIHGKFLHYTLYFISGKEFHEQMFTITNLPNIPTTMFSHLLLRLIKTVKSTSSPSATLTHIQGTTNFLKWETNNNGFHVKMSSFSGPNINHRGRPFNKRNINKNNCKYILLTMVSSSE